MTNPQKLTIVQAINRAIHDAMEADPKVLMLGEDVADPEEGGVMGASKGLSTKFGEDRVKSTPISEQAIVGSAVGAAIAGYRPIAEVMMMNFITIGMDMLVNHAAKLRFMSGGQTTVPIVVRTMTGTGLSVGGQHSDYLEAWFAHTAGIKVVAPSNPDDAYGLMRSAIEDEDPVLFIENTASYWTPGQVTFEKYPLGRARIAREGTDLTVVTYSAITEHCLKAASDLAERGVSLEVIDLRTIAPWDRDTVMKSVAKTGRLMIVHEAVKEFGVGAEIAAVVTEQLFDKLKSPPRRLGGAFCPVPFTKPLEIAFAPKADEIAAAAREILGVVETVG